MEAGLARLARQPGKRDEFLLCLYEKISSLGNGRVSRVIGRGSRVISRGSKVEVEGQKY
jgi:hypothetical protein